MAEPYQFLAHNIQDYLASFLLSSIDYASASPSFSFVLFVSSVLIFQMASSNSYSSSYDPVFSSPTPSRSSEENILLFLGCVFSRASWPLVFSDQRVNPAFPLSDYTTIYSPSFHAGFRNNLPWLMMEYCELVHLAPSQLDFVAWGLIHSFQVLFDLSGINITAEMIVGAFKATPLTRRFRQLTLVRREGRRKPSPVSLPSHMLLPPGDDHFLFLLHSGPTRLPTDWFRRLQIPNHDDFFLGHISALSWPSFTRVLQVLSPGTDLLTLSSRPIYTDSLGPSVTRSFCFGMNWLREHP